MKPSVPCAVCLLSALSIACAPAALIAPEPAPTPARLLLAPADVVALAELLRMEDRRELDAQRHPGLAAYSLPLVRGRAALAAGRIGGAGASTVLLPLLEDSVAAVRADAAHALGLLGDTSSLVIGALARVATQPQTDAGAVEAVWALGRSGGAAARDVLLGLLPAGPEAITPDARAAEAALALWRFPRRDDTVDRLVALSAHPDLEIRWRATYSLMRLAPPRAAAALQDRLVDDDALTRGLAARALRGPIVDSAGARPAARAALLQVLADEDPHVRINAARALGTYQESQLVQPLARLLADPDSNVVLAATEALAALGPAAASVLGSVVSNGTARLAVRAAALAGLARHAYDAADLTIADWHRSTDWLQRLYLARALAGAPWNLAGDRLRSLARDADARVAAAAYASLADAAPPSAARAMLIEGFAAPDPYVRAAAIGGIARNVQPADLGMLLEAFAAAERDGPVAAAMAAIDALVALAATGVPVHRSFYARFQAPTNPVVRRHAVERIAPSSWQWRPIDTGRPLDWYEQVVETYIAAPLAGARAPHAVVTGPTGEIVLELDGVHAPLTVHNFVSLAETGYFDASERRASPPRWHRVVPSFVLQDGDPRGDGLGGPGYAIRDELNRLRYGRGVVGMALAGPDTGGSQWFITHLPQPHLDGGYTVFGRVIGGLDVADRIVQDDPISHIRIERGEPLGGN
jgi:cyclophilin family peptidyl-prolyl cis-trans isomerase/HEAT repeat protein